MKRKQDIEIIERFQRLIRDKQISQMDLAKELGFSRTYLSSIITGRSDFSGAFIKALFKKGWPVKYLMTGKKEVEDADVWQKRALKAEEKLKLLEHYIERLEKLVKK